MDESGESDAALSAASKQRELVLEGIPPSVPLMTTAPLKRQQPRSRALIRLRFLVTVKAYPTLTDKHGEAVCCAGIRLDTAEPTWVRIFPVPHRSMGPEQKFAKYDVVEVDARLSPDDDRVESYQPLVDTLVIKERLGTSRGWLDRARFVEPLVGASLCDVQALGAGGPSLHAFRPQRPLVMTVERRAPRSPGKEGLAAQGDLMNPSHRALEDVPFVFRYEYRCGPTCQSKRGHRQTVLDWEIGEAYRSWRSKYGEHGAVERIKSKWQEQIASPDRDFVLFAGNTNAHRNIWCILGTYWPPAERQEELLLDV